MPKSTRRVPSVRHACNLVAQRLRMDEASNKQRLRSAHFSARSSDWFQNQAFLFGTWPPGPTCRKSLSTLLRCDSTSFSARWSTALSFSFKAEVSVCLLQPGLLGTTWGPLSSRCKASTILTSSTAFPISQELFAKSWPQGNSCWQNHKREKNMDAGICRRRSWGTVHFDLHSPHLSHEFLQSLLEKVNKIRLSPHMYTPRWRSNDCRHWEQTLQCAIKTCFRTANDIPGITSLGQKLSLGMVPRGNKCLSREYDTTICLPKRHRQQN